MTQNRKQTKGWLSEMISVITELNSKCIEELFENISSWGLKDKRTLSTEQENETKANNNQIEDESPLDQDNNLYNSYIHEEIPDINLDQDRNKENQNEIEQVIQIYNSKLIKSPLKSSFRTPDTNRKKIKSTNKDMSPMSHHERLLQIQKQKQRMEEDLKRLNEEMKEIKKEENESRVVKKHKDVSEDVEAAEQAQRMLMRIQKERKLLQEKKNKQQIKFLEQLEKQTTQKQLQRRENIERMRSQKRDQIAKKLEQKKREREEKSLINKQSNKLIKQLKKSVSMVKKNNGGLVNNVVQKKKSLYMNRNSEDKDGANSRSVFTEYTKPVKDYKSKPRLFNKKSENGEEDYPKPIVHYPKGKFLQLLQEQDKKRKEEERKKEDGKKQALEKRIKYGQLIKNLFVPVVTSKSRNKSNIEQPRIKPPTPEVTSNSKIRTSFTRKTQNPVYKKQPKSKQFYDKKESELSEKNSNISKDNSQQKKKRELKQRQIRKQTLLRLKKAQKKDEVIQTSRNAPKVEKYSNYLKDLPKHKPPQNNWKKILENDHLTKEQKYSQMLSQVNQMESKAKLNQQFHKGDDETMNLIIGSIQAKLALLDEL